MIKRLFKNEKGLTLVELLAVVVILGIISAIAAPSIGGLINQTEDDATVAEGIQIINAAKLFMASNNFTPDQAGGNTQTLTEEQLLDFLENVEDDDFTVVVTEGENGTFTYTLRNHDANNVLNEQVLTEDQLQDSL